MIATILALVIFFIFVLVWYLPLFLKHKKAGLEPAKFYLLAFVLGLASMAIALALQLGLQKIIDVSGVANKLPTVAVVCLETLLSASLIEELSKYAMGRLATWRVPNLSEAGCMLLFGMVGLSFEVVETFMGGVDLGTSIFRGVTAMHIFFQLWMGKFWWRAMNAKAKGDGSGFVKYTLISVLVPIIAHWLWDFGAMLMSGQGGSGELMFAGAVLVIVAAVAIIVATLRTCYKTANAELAQRAQDEA